MANYIKNHVDNTNLTLTQIKEKAQANNIEISTQSEILDRIEDILENIPSNPMLPGVGEGVQLPILTNEGNSSNLLINTQLIDQNGNIVNGTMPNNGAINTTIDGITTTSATIPAGYTTGGTISLDNTINNTVNQQANLIAQIKSVAESLPTAGSGSGGGDTSIEDAFVTGNLSIYTNNRVSSIGNYAFYACSNLTSVSFPACTSIGGSAFYSCSKLTTASFPVCTSIGGSAFKNCSNLTSISFPVCTSIGSYVFQYCSKLTSLTLGASSVATLASTNAFQSTPMSVSTLTGSFGSIYVPASLVDAYKSATNWVAYSNRIVGYSEQGGFGGGGSV